MLAEDLGAVRLITERQQQILLDPRRRAAVLREPLRLQDGFLTLFVRVVQCLPRIPPPYSTLIPKRCRWCPQHPFVVFSSSGVFSPPPPESGDSS